MAIENNIELLIRLDSNKILYEKSQDDGEPKSYPDDIEEKTLKIELQVARTFQKIFALLKTEKDFFQREDYELLGEMLRKILFGKILGEAVVEDNIRNQLELAKGKARCRVYLEFEKNCDLAILPWEYTIIKDTEKKPIYFAANKDKGFDVIRRIGGKGNVSIQTEKLFLILVVSSIRNKEENIPAIGDSEVDLVKKLFGNLKANYPDRFDFEVIENPDFDQLKGLLKGALNKFEKVAGAVPPYSIHYLGHSRFDKEGGKIVFLKSDHNAHWITDRKFAEMLDSVNLEFASPKMVVLQSCDSAKLSNYGEGSGVALSLVAQKIPAILGMQNEVDVETSTEFMKIYYESLLEGNDVGEATTAGRTYLGKGGQDEKGVYKRMATDQYKTNSFGSPVLFITTKQPIFFFDKQKATPVVSTEINVFKKCKDCKQETEVPLSQTNCKSIIRAPGRGPRVCNGLLEEIPAEKETNSGADSSNVQGSGAVELPVPAKATSK